MGIFYCEKDGTITLQTKNTTYQMKADRQGTLLHTYYGQKTDRTDKSYWICCRDRGFSGNPYGMGRAYSLDTLPQEYSCFGTGDYRISALKVKNTDGSAASALRYVSHEITEGKYSLPGLPAAYGTKEEAQTLIVTLRDYATNLKVELYYGVLEKVDLITRAVRIPGRKPCLSRNQLVLDFSRKDVQDYVIDRLKAVLSQAPISYVKWDFNRSICDKYSDALPKERQGEMAHRFVLGLYRVLEELIRAFPHILFEGCSGGGGRFDAGMLYYTPQIWCSDNTDAIERLKIQYGTSFGYPVSTMGSHVSAVPNHQTGRITPLSTRGCVAMAGTFGYELDVNRMTEAEKTEVREQIALFKKHYDLIQYGSYYRLCSPFAGTVTVWETVSPDGTEALVSAVYHHVQSNPAPVYVRLGGLREDRMYRLGLIGAREECTLPVNSGEDIFGQGQILSGAALMHCGLMVPEALNGFQAWQIYLQAQ